MGYLRILTSNTNNMDTEFSSLLLGIQNKIIISSEKKPNIIDTFTQKKLLATFFFLFRLVYS